MLAPGMRPPNVEAQLLRSYYLYYFDPRRLVWVVHNVPALALHSSSASSLNPSVSYCSCDGYE